MTELRSFGSNYFPSSQSRKISIGVIVDSFAKRCPESDKSDGDNLPRVVKLNSAADTDLETNKKGKDNSAANRRKSAEAPENVNSLQRSPKICCRKLGNLDKVLSKETSSLFVGKGSRKGLKEVNQAPADYSVQKLPNSNFQSNECKMDCAGRKKEKDATLPERLEELASAAMQEKLASGGVATFKPDNAKTGSTAALRTKLSEILGSSPKNLHPNSEAPAVVDNNNSHLGQDKHLNCDPLVDSKRNSDSIETDSECPENATKRPVSRPLLLKRVTVKGAGKKTKVGANLGKHKEQEKHIFSFEEGLRGQTPPAVKTSSKPKKPKVRRKRNVMHYRKVYSIEKDRAVGIVKETNNSKTLPPSDDGQIDRTPLFSNGKERFDGFPPQNNGRLQNPQTAKATLTKPGGFLGISGNRDEGQSKAFMEKPIEPLEKLHSPTLRYKAPSSSLSHCFSPALTPSHPTDHSPAIKESETPPRNFVTKETSQPTCQISISKRDVREKSRDYRFETENTGELNEYSEDISELLSDDRDSPEIGKYVSSFEERRTPSHSSGRRSNTTKRNFDRNGSTRLGELSLTLSSSPNEIHETDCFPGSPKMNEDDGLERAITLFALALQSFEKKVKSAARKKSSEIIASVSEEIHAQMETVQSNILTDVEKLSRLTKTKRKHAETAVQEQQEQLRETHEKFKDDISHHLEDFESSMLRVEANQTELKRAIKRQRASHQKLMAVLEGEIETQMNSATKRINGVNESARAKMMQVKQLVSECLKG